MKIRKKAAKIFICYKSVFPQKVFYVTKPNTYDFSLKTKRNYFQFYDNDNSHTQGSEQYSKT